MTNKFKEQHKYDLNIEGEREKRKFPDSKEDIKIEPGSTFPTTTPTEQIDSTSTSDVNTVWLDNNIEKRTSFININNLNELIKKYALPLGEFILYIDMDGVLVDFDKGFRQFGKGGPLDFMEKYGKPSFWKLMNQHPHFFLNLDWMPDGKELWNYVKQYDPIILTTPAHSMKYCKEDKKKWVKRHLGENIKVIFSSKKEKYANLTSILIDDRDQNIIPWKTSNGIGIKHISTNNTISKLKELIEKDYKRPKKVV